LIFPVHRVVPAGLILVSMNAATSGTYLFRVREVFRGTRFILCTF
jgi:hypothetical protein